MEQSKSLMLDSTEEEKKKIEQKMLKTLKLVNENYLNSQLFEYALINAFEKITQDSSENNVFVVLLHLRDELKTMKGQNEKIKKHKFRHANNSVTLETTDDSVTRDNFGVEKNSDSQSVDSMFSSTSLFKNDNAVTKVLSESSKSIMKTATEHLTPQPSTSGSVSSPVRSTGFNDNSENSKNNDKNFGSSLLSALKLCPIISESNKPASKDSTSDKKSASPLFFSNSTTDMTDPLSSPSELAKRSVFNKHCLERDSDLKDQLECINYGASTSKEGASASEKLKHRIEVKSVASPSRSKSDSSSRSHSPSPKFRLSAVDPKTFVSDAELDRNARRIRKLEKMLEVSCFLF